MALQESFLIFNSCFIMFLRLRYCDGAAFFPTNSAYGIFAAIAVPLDLPNRNVFLSYNFEANYNLPYTWNLPPVAYGLQDEDLFDGARQCANCTLNENTSGESKEERLTSKEEDITEETTTLNEETTDSTTRKPRVKRTENPAQRSLLSRTHFYHILMDKFQRSGYKGEPCLLRLICETNASDLGDINGILGNFIHIIFSPSTSMYEELPLAYYQAEIDGVHEQCEHYVNECKDNLLDLISKPLIDIMQNIMANK